MPLYHQPEPAAPTSLRARRRPRQARSQVTVAAILEATARVLLKHGYEGCTTKVVAEVAGVGIGSVYEYFPNKEALIAALVEREADRYMAVLTREMIGTFERPFAEALRVALSAAMGELELQRPLVSLLVREYPYMGQLAALGRLPQRAAGLAAVCLRRWGAEVSVTDHPATYHVLANMLIGACVSHMLVPAAQVSSEAFLDALVEILLRVLTPQSREPYPSSVGAAE
jgi:AcrR family transcriptional regulator